MKDSFINSIGIYGRRHDDRIKRTDQSLINVIRMNACRRAAEKTVDNKMIFI